MRTSFIYMLLILGTLKAFGYTYSFPAQPEFFINEYIIPEHVIISTNELPKEFQFLLRQPVGGDRIGYRIQCGTNVTETSCTISNADSIVFPSGLILRDAGESLLELLRSMVRMIAAASTPQLDIELPPKDQP